ncbi:MAG: ribonuclease HI [Oscillospiraceae bacterium]|nr:ribonuclease HI [Oscillospiraceae bacterium]
MKCVEIYTDGACSGNPGPGGWAAILKYGEFRKEMSGGEKSTTNNRMELTGAIEGLSALKEPCKVKLYSDSQYLVRAINEGWAEKWKAKGWMRTKNEPALNSDLWEQLLQLLSTHSVEFIWVRGHNGHAENVRCDRLAVAQRDAHSANG